MNTTAQKLAAARVRYASARAAFTDAECRVGLPTDDPGALSGIRVSNPARHAARQAKSWDRALDAYRAMEDARKTVEHLEHRVAAEEREARIRATAHRDIEALRPGDLIRWETRGSTVGNVGRVVRVNAKTVTLEAAPGMDQQKVPYDRIVETRHQEAP